MAVNMTQVNAAIKVEADARKAADAALDARLKKIEAKLTTAPVPAPAPIPAPAPAPTPVPAQPIPAGTTDMFFGVAPTPAMVTSSHGQVISGHSFYSDTAHCIDVRHNNVVIEYCRIRQNSGFQGIVNGAAVSNLTIRDASVENIGARASGANSTSNQNNISLESVTGLTVQRVTVKRGSSGIYLHMCSGAILLEDIEGHDPRGPMPRGQLFQANDCGPGTLRRFSIECTSTSIPEDSINVFQSDPWLVEQGLIAYNNSPSGWGVLAEDSGATIFQDIDFVGMGNGAAAMSGTGSVGGILRRCRTKDSVNIGRDGRAAPTSNCLAFGSINGATQTHIDALQYFNVGNPGNIHFDWATMIVDAGTTNANFTPRAPVRNVFPWAG